MKKININYEVSDVTKQVINDYNTMSDWMFESVYQCTKKTYYRRVRWYKDPYMYSPLAILGKLLCGKSIFK